MGAGQKHIEKGVGNLIFTKCFLWVIINYIVNRLTTRETGVYDEKTHFSFV